MLYIPLAKMLMKFLAIAILGFHVPANAARQE